MRIGLLLLVLQSVLLCASAQAQIGLPKTYKADGPASFFVCNEKSRGSSKRAGDGSGDDKGDDNGDGEAQIAGAFNRPAVPNAQIQPFPFLVRRVLHGGKVDNIRAPPSLQ